MTAGWVTVGTWVTFNKPGVDSDWLGPEHGNTIGFVFAITPCARVAVLVPFDGYDEIAILDPGEIVSAMRPDDVKNALHVLSPAEVDSITFDTAERQLRIDAVRQAQQEVSHA